MDVTELTEEERTVLGRLLTKALVVKQHDIRDILPRAKRKRVNKLARLSARCINHGAYPIAAHLMNEAVMILRSELWGSHHMTDCPKFVPNPVIGCVMVDPHPYEVDDFPQRWDEAVKAEAEGRLD